MGTKSREVIFGSRVRGARIRALGAREDAIKAVRAADRAEAEAWSIQMEAFGGPAQPSPTIGQCLNGGYGWMEVKCRRCETSASIPLDANHWPGALPIPRRDYDLICKKNPGHRAGAQRLVFAIA
jgi:hypothetical protein